MAYGFTLTVDATASTLGSTEIAIKPFSMPTAAIDGGATSVLNGGGNLKAYTDSTKTTQLPVHVIKFVTGVTPDILWRTRLPSVAVGSTIYVEADEVQTTQPAASAVYGSQAVWQDAFTALMLTESSGTLFDSSPNGRDATPVNLGAGDYVTSGLFGNGVYFDNNNNYLTLGTQTLPHDLSFLAVFNPTTYRGNAPDYNDTLLSAGIDNNVNGAIQVNFTDGGTSIRYGGNSGIAGSAPALAQDNTIGITRDGTGDTGIVSVNGVSVTAAGKAYNDITNEVTIGKLQSQNAGATYAYHPHGTLSMLVIWDKTVSAAQHEYISGNLLATTSWGTVGTWADAGGGGGFQAAWVRRPSIIIGA
tara:strand:+ start:670 stop:1749 length:1080 start_codon:yes stop_codon:yes gene_type:complete